MVGGYQDASGRNRGFLLNASGFSTIDFPNTMSTNARGINSEGDIVGFYRDSAGRDRGYLLRR